jgi:AAA+ ATPase superfamily predicted ATPase
MGSPSSLYIGKPSPTQDIVDRQKEVGEIVERCSGKNKINYAIALLGYRRIGKTTILLKAKEELESQGVVVVYFDVRKNLSDPANLLNLLQRAVFNAYTKRVGLFKKSTSALKNASERAFHIISQAIKGIKGVSVQLTLKPDGALELEPKLEFGRRPNYAEMFEASFESINRVSKTIDGKVVIMLDEFQDLFKLHRYRGLANIMDRFRSVIQDRAKNLSYIVSGSQVHLTREFMEKGSGTAFLHFIELDVRDLDENSAAELFAKYSIERLKKPSNDKKIEASAKHAYRLVGGNPFYLMSLAEGWDGKTKLEDAYHELLVTPRKPLALYAEYVLAADLANAKRGEPALRTILSSLARSPKSVGELSADIRAVQAGLPSYLSELIKYDLVTFRDNKYEVRDKIVRDYLNFSK